VFDAAERVRIVCDMIRTVVGSRVQLDLDIDCDNCFVEADIAQFETALINIAVNARDAMNGEGMLSISARSTEAAQSELNGGGGTGALVAISVSDTGRGIPPELLGQIFEPFFTTKEVGKGTGLGLSQVYGFAKQSGGDVQVESEVGRGTTFTLYLPRVETEPAAERQERSGNAESASAGTRILVVEDNEDVGEFARQLLEEIGHDATRVGSAAEALERLEADPDAYDLVFTDVVMAGMTGIELGEEIRRRWPGLRVVLTSGYSHVLAQQGRHGFELLQKPYSVESLSRILRSPSVAGTS
jgi:CheY-like chemotaxis protein